MADTTRIFLGLMVVLACLMASSQAFIIRGLSEAEVVPTDPADNDEVLMMSEMMTSEEEAEVDEMFPDRMRDDLKLELILKALEILKTYEGHVGSVSTWLPSYDVMPDELKLRLILKAIILLKVCRVTFFKVPLSEEDLYGQLLKDRPMDSMFAGHVVAKLELTLILKAVIILEESETDFDLVADTGDLKLALLLKAIEILEVYKGEFVDTVFWTESTKQLKLKLILKAITLLKQGNWPVDIDFWPMGEEEEEEEGSQSEAITTAATEAITEQTTEATTTEQTTEAMETTEGPATEEATPRPVTAKKHWLKKGVSKVFGWLKSVAKVIHKKKHHIFHKFH